LNELTKDHITEVKSYKNPTQDIAMVMFAVMTLLGHDASWPVCQKVLADPEFTKKLKEDFDKDNVPQKKLTAIERYTKKENFAPEYIKSKSLAAGVLCLWV